MDEKQDTLTFQNGPQSYTVVAKPIKTFQVQESDLRRLKEHLTSINELKLKIDFFTLFLGATLSTVITFFIEWHKTGSPSLLYLGLAFITLAASFICYLWQKNSLNLERAQHLLNEAQKDIQAIFDKANISN